MRRMYSDLQCEVSLPLLTLELLHFAFQIADASNKLTDSSKKLRGFSYLHALSYQMAPINCVVANGCRSK
jgi:hypothetical protein